MNIELMPGLVKAGLIRYRDGGIPPGHFCQAVLQGDLFEAVRRADDQSLAALAEIVIWIERNMPRGSFGSPESFKGWTKAFDDLRAEGKRNVRYHHSEGTVSWDPATPEEEEALVRPKVL